MQYGCTVHLIALFAAVQKQLVLSETLFVLNCRPVVTWRPLLAHVQQQAGTEAEMQVKARIKQYYWCRDCKRLIDAVGISLSLLRTRVNTV